MCPLASLALQASSIPTSFLTKVSGSVSKFSGANTCHITVVSKQAILHSHLATLFQEMLILFCLYLIQVQIHMSGKDRVEEGICTHTAFKLL